MTSSNNDKVFIPIQTLENENQTLLPQIHDPNETNDTSLSPQTNNSLHEGKFKDAEKSSTRKYPVITKSSKDETNKTRKNGCCKYCTCRCCAITSGVIIALIAVILIVGGVMWKQRQDAAKEQVEKFEAGSEEWEKKLEEGKLKNRNDGKMEKDNGNSNGDNNSGMTGTYELKGYDKNYEAYMKAFGIPSLILAFIIGTPEKLIITEPDENNNFYTLKKITGDGFRVEDHKFPLNVEHKTMYNKGKGVMHTICTIPETNVLECNSEERSKEWKITNRLDFNALGIINTRTFHTKDIVAKKYYERQGIDISEEQRKSETISDSEMIKIEKSDESNAEDPFGEDEFEDDDEWK